jgi:hypothetical protein
MLIRAEWEAALQRLVVDEYEYVGEALMFNFSRQKMQDAMDVAAGLIEAHKQSAANGTMEMGGEPIGDVAGQARAWQKIRHTCVELGLNDFGNGGANLTGVEQVVAFIQQLASRKETMEGRTQKLETALKWAMDTLDAYDAEFVRRGDSPQDVYSMVHVLAKREVRKIAKASPLIPQAEAPTAADKAVELLRRLDQKGGLGLDVHERIREILKEADGGG